MSIFSNLAFWGGLFALISTTLGSLSVFFFKKYSSMQSIKMSMDFFLGIMFSAAAFSMVGPEVVHAIKEHSYPLLVHILLGVLVGVFFVVAVQKITNISSVSKKNTHFYLLALTLIFHNFPEGMGAGAALMGLKLEQAVPIQIAISIQNIPEGLLLTLLMLEMRLSLFRAISIGVASGVVELLGALASGYFIQASAQNTSLLLSIAGGAMIASVLFELAHQYKTNSPFKYMNFVYGLLLTQSLELIF